MTSTAAKAWSQEEFGRAGLGNTARTRRLVELGNRAAAARGGCVTRVCPTSAEREAAYRFLESPHFSSNAILEASQRAAVARVDRRDPYVVVPVDKTSLRLSDPQRTREIGRMSSSTDGSRGVHVMTAMLVAKSGVPLGLGAQRYWLRPDELVTRRRRRKPVEQKESGRFLECIEDVIAACAAEGAPKPWFQIDRGGDIKEMFALAASERAHFTFRASWNRRLDAPGRHYLRDSLRCTPRQGEVDLDVRRSGHRVARRARLALRWRRIPVLLWDHIKSRYSTRTLTAVRVVEVSRPPAGEERIEWTLWTTHACETLDDALLVVRNYALRWRIEDFHRTWKSTCRVEDNWLHSLEAITRWAAILAAVSTRIERLRHLARASPELPATVELTNDELDALHLLRKQAPRPREFVLSIRQAVRWIADLGGYSGPAYPRGEPGAVTIGRGLEWLAGATAAVTGMRQKP